MTELLQIIAAAGVVAGSLFGLLAAIGLVRFPDLYTRLHAAAKAGVVGTGIILLSLALVALDLGVFLRVGLVILFLLLTTPISAHLLARSSYTTGNKPGDLTKTNEMT